jgi:NADPH-dependent curcumin reductase CurA
MARVWYFASRPTGIPTESNFQLRDVDLPTLSSGEVRVRNRWLSVDPYMRLRMLNINRPDYLPYRIGEPLHGGAVGKVIESQASEFAVGDRVIHSFGWRDEWVCPASALKVLPARDLPEQLFLGILGMPGLTAYVGLMHVSEIKPGETLFVSAAAGAVGSTVVQIAKLMGLTVIGSAGGIAKCEFVRSIGADAAIDYKTPGTMIDKLAAATPQGIDVYFDNVGGNHLDAALANARNRARFAMCGMISDYSSMTSDCLYNLKCIVLAHIRLQGFYSTDFPDRHHEFERDMTQWVRDGMLRIHETIRDGLESTPAALISLLEGFNVGKMLVKL